MQITFGLRVDTASKATINKYGNPIINPEQQDALGNTIKDKFHPVVSHRKARQATNREDRQVKRQARLVELIDRNAQKLLASMPKVLGLQGGYSQLMSNSSIFIPNVEVLKSLGISSRVIKKIQSLSHDVVTAHDQHNKLNAEKQAAEAEKLAAAEKARQQVIAKINFGPFLRLN